MGLLESKGYFKRTYLYGHVCNIIYIMYINVLILHACLTRCTLCIIYYVLYPFILINNEYIYIIIYKRVYIYILPEVQYCVSY